MGIGEDEMEQDMHWRVSGVPLWLRGGNGTGRRALRGQVRVYIPLALPDVSNDACNCRSQPGKIGTYLPRYEAVPPGTTPCAPKRERETERERERFTPRPVYARVQDISPLARSASGMNSTTESR